MEPPVASQVWRVQGRGSNEEQSWPLVHHIAVVRQDQVPSTPLSTFYPSEKGYPTGEQWVWSPAFSSKTIPRPLWKVAQSLILGRVRLQKENCISPTSLAWATAHQQDKGSESLGEDTDLDVEPTAWLLLSPNRLPCFPGAAVWAEARSEYCHGPRDGRKGHC